MTEPQVATREVPWKCRRCDELFLSSGAMALHFGGGGCRNPTDVGLGLIVLGDRLVWAVPADTSVIQP